MFRQRVNICWKAAALQTVLCSVTAPVPQKQQDMGDLPFALSGHHLLSCPLCNSRTAAQTRCWTIACIPAPPENTFILTVPAFTDNSAVLPFLPGAGGCRQNQRWPLALPPSLSRKTRLRHVAIKGCLHDTSLRAGSNEATHARAGPFQHGVKGKDAQTAGSRAAPARPNAAPMGEHPRAPAAAPVPRHCRPPAAQEGVEAHAVLPAQPLPTNVCVYISTHKVQLQIGHTTHRGGSSVLPML